MTMKNVYLLLVGVLLISFTACKKSDSNNNSGNVSGADTTVKVTIAVPSGVPAAQGVTFLNSGTSAVINLYAPGKNSVSVFGEFNNYAKIPMTKSSDGYFYIQLNGLKPGDQYAYQFYIDGALTVADPYAHMILDPNNDKYINTPTTVYPNLKSYPSGKMSGICGVMQSTQSTSYTWKVTSFTKPAQKNLAIYELLPRDFVATHSYTTITDSLDYLANLGINAIELMPVNEFEGNDSWGYNSNFMFALDKYYGTPNAYKAFIDACHARGIAVIQDIVLEDQFGSSPMVQMYANADGSPAANNPWFDQTNMHPDAVGWQLNHSQVATQTFTENVMKYWIQEYHIDGLRFDEAKGYTQVASTSEDQWAQYDATRVALWTKYNAYMKTLDPNFYVILEMFSANNEEAQYVNQGMMVWTNLSTPGEQAMMSYNDSGGSWDISGLFYDGYGFPSTSPSAYGLIAYFESHDQERLQFKNGQYGNASPDGTYAVKTLATGLARDEMGAAFMFSSPGPKMIWQFGELGYDISIDQNGRTGDKPILWNYFTNVSRKHLYTIYSKMIHWKTNNPVFTTTNFKYSLGGAVKTIQLLDPTAAANVEVVGNFDVVSQTASVSFPSTGTYIDNITGTNFSVTSVPMTMTLAPGEYHVYSSAALK